MGALYGFFLLKIPGLVPLIRCKLLLTNLFVVLACDNASDLGGP